MQTRQVNGEGQSKKATTSMVATNTIWIVLLGNKSSIKIETDNLKRRGCIAFAKVFFLPKQ